MTRMPTVRQRLLLGLLAVMVACSLAGCGGDGGESDATEAAPAVTGDWAPSNAGTGEVEGIRCVHNAPDLVAAIEANLEGGGTLEDVAFVRSVDFESVYYVSAKLNGEVGTWAGTGISGAPAVLPVDPVAQAAWASEDDPAAAEGAADVMSLDNDGAQESRDCVGSR